MDHVPDQSPMKEVPSINALMDLVTPAEAATAAPDEPSLPGDVKQEKDRSEHLRLRISVAGRGRVVAAASARPTIRLIVLDQAAVRKEQHLDGDRQGEVQHQDENQKNLARLLVGSAQDRVQIAQ